MVAPLLPITLAFCLGIGLGKNSTLPCLAGLSIAILSLAACWATYLYGRSRLFSLLALSSSLWLGMTWMLLYPTLAGPQHLNMLLRNGQLDLSQPCRLTGVCSESAVNRQLGEEITLDVETIENGFCRYATSGKVRLALYQTNHDTRAPQEDNSTALLEQGGSTNLPSVLAGDRVEVLARLKQPANFNNPGCFDSAAYLARQNIWLVGTIKDESLITRLAPVRLYSLERPVARIRQWLLTQIERLFGGSGAISATLRALLVGEKHSLPPAIETSFLATGTYHLLVVSGQHIAIMGGALLFLLRWLRLPRAAQYLLTLAGLLFYMLVAQCQPSIARATLMAAVFLASLYFDRDRSGLNSLSLAALALLLANPLWLFDPGFQLSFLAVLSILVIGVPLLRCTTLPIRGALQHLDDPGLDGSYPPRWGAFRFQLRQRLNQWQSQRWPRLVQIKKRLLLQALRFALALADVFLISLSVQMVFFPLMAIYFHRVSLISILLNVVAVPLVGIIVPLGFLCLLLSPAPGSIALPLAKICASLTGMLLEITQFFSGPSWGNFRVPALPGWLAACYAAGLLLLCLFRGQRWLASIGGLAWMSTLALLIVYPFAPRLPAGDLQVTLLDVRQGDSIFIKFPDKTTMLLDGGGLPAQSFGEDFSGETFDIGEQVVSPYLWSLGLKRLDVMAISHPHQDHIGGLFSVLNNFEVKEVWVGKTLKSQPLLLLLKLALAKGARLRFFSEGDTLELHGSRISFFNPARTLQPDTMPSDNESLAFRLQFGKRTFLFTGDAGKKSEDRWLGGPLNLQADFLKLAHHGSRSATSPRFLERVNPAIALISVSATNPFRHPHPEVLERLARRQMPIFRTDQRGAITIATDGKTINIRTYLE